MKIIFICGCLEPGKDGVGDYTRRLSGELIRQGIKVGMLAFNDNYIQTVNKNNQQSEDIIIPSLRLSKSLKNKERLSIAKQWIDLENPEWLSLQFVPYAFQNKGLPFILISQLKKLGSGRKWHIMFHELWLGLRNNDSLKFRIIGFIQKNIVKLLIKKINVKVVHTHTQFYLRELIKLNLMAKYLPLFGNIPINKNHVDNRKPKVNKVSLVIFGAIHSGAPVNQFAQEVSEYFNENKQINVNLLIVGNSGSELENWVKVFKLYEIEVNVFGELTTKQISSILQEASFGITTNPVFVVEKSGTVAAMREHNLPILVVAEKTYPRNKIKLNLDSDILEYNKFGDFSNFINAKTIKSKPDKKNGVAEISLQLLNSFE